MLFVANPLSPFPLPSCSTVKFPNSHLSPHMLRTRNNFTCFSTDQLTTAHFISSIHKTRVFVDPKLPNPNLTKPCNFHYSSNFRITHLNASKLKRDKRELTLSCSLSPWISNQSCHFNCEAVKLGFYGTEKLITSRNYRVYCANCVNLRYGFDGTFKSNLGIRWRSRAVMNEDKAVGREGEAAEKRENYDAIVIGSGIGGLVAATQFWCWRSM